MTRVEQISAFMDMALKLEMHAICEGIPIRDGEAHRPKEMADLYFERGTGTLNSKHRYGLARDYWITDARGNPIFKEDPRYDLLGAYWKSMGGTWGGDFKRRDIYHFEIKGKRI